MRKRRNMPRILHSREELPSRSHGLNNAESKQQMKRSRAAVAQPPRAGERGRQVNNCPNRNKNETSSKLIQFGVGMKSPPIVPFSSIYTL